MTPTLLLLVEDEALILVDVKDSLHDAGFKVVAVHDGKQALAELDADATRFKAVITDVQLGDGPDGWEVGRHARELVPDMPVIYTSGGSSRDWSSKGVPDSVMIAKPFVPAQLITAVSTLITNADIHRQAPPETP
jgi:DNA-binding response OmpR family regulator